MKDVINNTLANIKSIVPNNPDIVFVKYNNDTITAKANRKNLSNKPKFFFIINNTYIR